MSKASSLCLSSRLDHCGQCYRIRPLLAKDLPAILNIENRSHEYPWSRSNFESSLRADHCIGLFANNDQLVAYSVISVILDEAELLLFVIDKCLWGRGLASTFLRSLTSSLSKVCASVFLELRVTNLGAHNLYTAVGFNEIGIRSGYYPGSKGTRVDAVLMALEFTADTHKD